MAYFASFADSFTGPDESPLSEGGAWTSGPGAFEGVQRVSGHVELFAAGPFAAARLAVPAFPDDHSAACRVSFTSGSLLAGPCVRMVSVTLANCYFLAAAPANGVVALFKVTDVSGNVVRTTLVNFVTAVVSGDVLTLTARGSVLEGFQNGVSLGTFTDATYATGQPGFAGNTQGQASNLAFDDFFAHDLLPKRLPVVTASRLREPVQGIDWRELP